MNEPNAEKILSLLVDLYAAQQKVKVKYTIVTTTTAAGKKKKANVAC